MTSDVSRILWFYYNDPVRSPSPTQHGICFSLLTQLLDNALPHLRRERALFCFPLPRPLGVHTDFPSHLESHSHAGGSHLARTNRSHLFPHLRAQEHHQRRSVVEGFQDSGRSRFGREGEGQGSGQIRKGLRGFTFTKDLPLASPRALFVFSTLPPPTVYFFALVISFVNFAFRIHFTYNNGWVYRPSTHPIHNYVFLCISYEEIELVRGSLIDVDESTRARNEKECVWGEGRAQSDTRGSQVNARTSESRARAYGRRGRRTPTLGTGASLQLPISFTRDTIFSIFL